MKLIVKKVKMTKEEKDFSFPGVNDVYDDYYTFEIKDPITLSLVQKIVERSKRGQIEYGQTLQDEVDKDIKNVSDYLIDVVEELVDAVNYANAALQSLYAIGVDPKLFKK